MVPNTRNLGNPDVALIATGPAACIQQVEPDSFSRCRMAEQVKKIPSAGDQKP